MIELRTGLPGNAKTLSVIYELYKRMEKWDSEDNPDARPVFQHNVKNLALPVSLLPLKDVKIGGRDRQVPDWAAVPDGSFIIIDEAQDFFPMRSSASELPEHVAFLNTHRHKGLDILVVTQHPKLIDPNLRALVGKHIHMRRAFGWPRSIMYEWDMCSDGLSLKSAVTTSSFKFPKEAYKLYKSAEVHTKQKFKYPLWLLIPVIGVVMACVFVPKAAGIIGRGIAGKPLSESAAVAPTVSAAKSAGGAAVAAPTQTQPAVPVAASVPQIAYVGCIANEKRTVCLTSDGKMVDAPDTKYEDVTAPGKLIPVAMTYPLDTPLSLQARSGGDASKRGAVGTP